MNCQYCGNKFSSIKSLKHHQKLAKYCLKLRGEKEYNFECSGCKKTYTCRKNLELHERKCNVLHSKNQEEKHNKEINMYKQELKNMEDEYKKKLLFQAERYRNRFESMHESYEKELKLIRKQEKENKKQIKDLQDTLKDITLKSVSKSTTTNNNNKTKIINNYIQNLKPLTEEHLAECSKHLTLEQIKRGASGYAEYALKYPFKDTVLCVDYSRHKIKMKDKDGHVITDPEMLTSSKMFFKSIFTRNKQLLEEYSNEKKDVINKHGQDYADKLAFELLHYIADVSRGMEGEQSELQRNFVKEICSKKTV